MLGLPHTFFESTIAISKAPESKKKKKEKDEIELENRHKKEKAKLDHDVEFEKARQLLVTKLRQKWMNIKNSLNHIFRKQRGQDYFSSPELFNTFWNLGMGLTHKEIEEIMSHYDTDGDGKVEETMLRITLTLNPDT